MYEYVPMILGVLAAGVVATLSGPWFVRAAWRVGMIDRPKLRGVHSDIVPRAGGMTVVASLLLALLVQMLTAKSMGLDGAYLKDVEFVYLLLPALALFGLGALDDIRSIAAPTKLFFQVLAALWAWSLGFRIDSFDLFGLIQVETGFLSLPLTLVFIVAITNAYNMIDGIDGLCTGTAAIGLIGIGVFALVGSGDVQLSLALPLAAAALAFMRINLGRPRAFLGDSGSMLLGFMTGALALRGIRTEAGAIDVVPGFLLMSLPIIDITTVFFRRMLQGRSPLRADRGHIHHIALLIFDGNTRRASFTLLAMVLFAAASAQLAGLRPEFAAAALALPCGLYMVVYALGGYLSPQNLRIAGPATDIAEVLAERAENSGPEEALDDPGMIRLLDLTRITAIELLDDDGRSVWHLGRADGENVKLEIPLYASGKVHCGHLIVAGAARPRYRLAFAAHLLLPLYPAFMEALQNAAEETRERPATVHEKM